MKDFDIDFELLIVLYLILNIIYVYNKNISTGIREEKRAFADSIMIPF